ncbi:RNA polymerase sigma-54 factor [Clostridium punense]|uniref:RNA polymerase sigma-54 factor n=1 Tax=Clostridium punense TaxID=1054297 RepID=A0ABS4K378_9CLOT|nr:MULTISPECIES: RNA polymerase factor sigma-54 [Clostridium]EQB90035.1 hypothetical protein M918_02025 [Clostridium sp. BL8]MBP2022235.1 RNA polymerase sigma-54 factor [Clostridium punense]
MHLDFGLKLTQEQKLVMTTEMQLSIRLLQMSSYELIEYVNKEIQENIVLEYSNNSEIVISESNIEKDGVNHKEIVKYLEFDNYSSKSYNINNSEEEISPFSFISVKSTLKDFLYEQLSELNLESSKLTVCKYIVENLDSKGYLDIELDLICEELGITKEFSEQCLNTIQHLDPCGIGARNLSECLMIQIHRKGLYHKDLEEIILNNLNLLSENKFSAIAKKMNISPLQVQKYGDLIKSLEPKPSRGFYTGEEITYIIPDAYIQEVQGEYLVIMNESIVPRLHINNIYKEVISLSEDKVAIEYVKEKINSALFLMKSIDSRKRTLHRVINEIITLQIEYFKYGEEYLKPMTIKSIAINLSLHESTVSRAIRDKYIALNTGKIIKIKDLFTNGIAGNKDNFSTQNIKRIIKEIIEEENVKKPLSDSNICEILNHRGFNLSRRTIAKYREEMGIKSSSQRKRL